MSANHDFIVQLARSYCPPPCHLLDFGCGAGEVVAKALAAGFDASGVDSFADVWEQYEERATLLGERIRHVAHGAPLPFANASFDAVVSNQVMEHIDDLQSVVSELARVLRPGGVLIAIFPTREVVVEPHLKAPFIHWLAPGSRAQRRLLAAVHALGLGTGAEGARADWIGGATDSLRRHMFYRTLPQALAEFRPSFELIGRGEAAFLRDRLARSPRLRRLAFLAAPRWLEPLLRTLCVRLANAVLVFRRGPAQR